MGGTDAASFTSPLFGGNPAWPPPSASAASSHVQAEAGSHDQVAAGPHVQAATSSRVQAAAGSYDQIAPGSRVKAARKAARLSQSDLAQAAGVTRQTIGLIEAGSYNPTLKLCLAICKTLGYTLDQLFWE